MIDENAAGEFVAFIGRSEFGDVSPPLEFRVRRYVYSACLMAIAEKSC